MDALRERIINEVKKDGIHKGGSAREGTRCLMQGIYLKQTAPLIQNGILGTFNHNEKVNIINYESDKFKSLTKKQQYMLS